MDLSWYHSCHDEESWSQAKNIISSHNPDPESLGKLSDKVLRCLYDPKKDLIGIKFSFNPSKKKKRAKTMPDLTLLDVDTFYQSNPWPP